MPQTVREFHPVRSRYLVITLDYLAPLLLVAGSLLTWWLVFYSPIFAVKKIDCELDFDPCQNPHILTELDKYLGMNLLRFNSAQLKSRLTGADFTIRQVEIGQSLPGTLLVSLQSVYPTVAARLKNQAQWVYFDDRLRVIGQKSSDPNVPTLVLPELRELVVGEIPTQPDLIYALKLTRRLAEEINDISSVELSDSTIILTLPNGRRALLSVSGDETIQIHALQSILQNDTILTGVATIDVRFSQPVLR